MYLIKAEIWCLLTVSCASDGAAVEGHDVLRQGASLVTEDVLDLAQFLTQGGGPGLGWRVALDMVHLAVPVDEEAATQAGELHAAAQTEKAF